MPTIFSCDGFRFFFFSKEGKVPPHIHVERVAQEAKFWLGPVRIARNNGFPAHELAVIRRLVDENSTLFEEAWNARRPG